MSRERRIQQKERHIRRQVNHYMVASHNPLSNLHVKEPHRLAKRNAFNCGSSNCMFCANPRKIFNEPTLQERRFHNGADLDGLE
jgi:hypothetical protein